MGKPPGDWNVFGAAGGTTPEMLSKAMSDLLSSDSTSGSGLAGDLPPSAEASARALDAYLTMSASAHKLFAQFMGQILGQLNMPTQGEVVSIAERLTNIEMRLDDLDAQLEEMAHHIKAIASVLPALIGSGKGESTAKKTAGKRVQGSPTPHTRRHQPGEPSRGSAPRG